MPTVKIPISKPYWNIDRVSKSINVSDVCYDSYIDESGTLRRRVGLYSFANLGGITGNGIYYWQQVDKIVAVSAGKCYLVSRNGTTKDISGSVKLSGNPIIFAAGNTLSGAPFLYMADGGYLVYTTGSNCVRLDESTGCPSTVSHVTWLASRFICNKAGTRQFFATDTDPATGEISNTYWLASDNPLTAEVMPDAIAALFSDFDELYVWGSQSLEVWRDDAVFFSPIDGAMSSVGLIAPYSAVSANNTIYGLCDVDGGTKRAVVMFKGRTPQVVSLPIENMLAALDNPSDAIGFLVGDSKYVISFISDNVTFCYDYARDQWTQWSWFNVEFNQRERFIGQFSCGAWGSMYAQSRRDGTIYRLSADTFTDAGDTMRPEFVTGNVDHGTSLHKRCKNLTIRIKSGSTTSYVTEPKLMVRYRDNGDEEWTQEIQVGLGLQGQRDYTKTLWRLGRYVTRQWSVVMTDAVDLAIVSLEEDVELLSV